MEKRRDFTENDLVGIIDATEIQIQRPAKNQRKYSEAPMKSCNCFRQIWVLIHLIRSFHRRNAIPLGKKKHTMKFEVAVDGRILDISKCYPGKTHDFKIRKSEKPFPPGMQILADSGYQGLQKIHKNTILPYKRRRKQPLDHEQKAHNRELSSKTRSLV